MNSTCSAGLLLFILGAIFIVLFGPIIAVGGVFSLGPGAVVVGAILMWIGMIFIPIGIILAVIGAVTSPKVQYVYTQTMPPQQYHYPQPVQHQMSPQVKYCLTVENKHHLMLVLVQIVGGGFEGGKNGKM
jgi:hypothetical protein